MSTNVEIKTRLTGKVLYAAKVEQTGDMALRAAIEQAVKSNAHLLGAYLLGANLHDADLRGAYLRGAYLRGADLRGADLSDTNLSGADLSDTNLSGANLSGADLRGAYLRGAYLSGADLRGADLSDTNLRGADLRGAYLSGAYLSGEDRRLTLVGDRPYLSIGPIGSEYGTLDVYLTDAGSYLRRGCFFGSIDEFEMAVTDKHGSNDHGQEYRAAIEMARAYATIWNPATEGAA